MKLRQGGRTMGKGRIPGPFRRATLSMRSPNLEDVDLALLDDYSDQPLIFRLDSHTLSVGTPTDVDVTPEPDKGNDLFEPVMPDEFLATLKKVGEDSLPVVLRPTRDLGGQIKFKIEKPIISVDLKSGTISGTAVLSIPSDYPAQFKSPMEIPVTIIIQIPQSAEQLSNLHAEIYANPFSYVADRRHNRIEATVEVRYDRNLLAKLVNELADAAKNLQKGGKAGNLSQVAFDVEDLVRHVVPALAKSLLVNVSGKALLTRFDVDVDPIQKTIPSYHTSLGLIPIPSGSIFDFPALGLGGSRKHGNWSMIGGLLAYPALPSIFSGAHPTKMFPAYGYVDVSYVRKISHGLDLGIGFTFAGNIWQLSGLEPLPAPDAIYAPIPGPGPTPAKYFTDRAKAILDVKNMKGPQDDIRPTIMFRVE